MNVLAASHIFGATEVAKAAQDRMEEKRKREEEQKKKKKADVQAKYNAY